MQQGKKGLKKCQDSNENQQKAISDELAAALNDGLVFYEQVALETEFKTVSRVNIANVIHFSR
jgi:hypothetical protein